jgi:hypothetical protein
LYVNVCPKIIHYGQEMEFPKSRFHSLRKNFSYVVEVGVVKDERKITKSKSGLMKTPSSKRWTTVKMKRWSEKFKPALGR